MAEKDHDCTNYYTEMCSQCQHRVVEERDGWKASADLRQATCDQLAKLADEWKRRAEELERIARIQQEEMDKIERERDALAAMVAVQDRLLMSWMIGVEPDARLLEDLRKTRERLPAQKR